jgi:hypothetical protein
MRVDDVGFCGTSINGVSQAPARINGIRFLNGRACASRTARSSGSRIADDMEPRHDDAQRADGRQLELHEHRRAGHSRTRAGAVAPSASLDHVRINRAQIGVDVVAGIVTISNAVISHVTAQAVLAENAAVVNLVSAVISNSGTGVSAAGRGSLVRLANCDIMSNTTGVNVAAGATGQRFANSRILGNGSDVVGTLTIVPNQ